jgi:hypothetical protein
MKWRRHHWCSHQSGASQSKKSSDLSVLWRGRLMDTGTSQQAACEEVNIHHSMYALWKKQVGVIVDIKNIRSKSLCLGRASCLAPHREELLRFIFELREQGMAVLVSMVAVKAAQISQDFALKSRIAKYNSARRFVRSQGLVFRLPMSLNARQQRQQRKHWTS